jgi:hypothetical protein
MEEGLQGECGIRGWGRLERIRGSHWKGVFSKMQLIIQSSHQSAMRIRLPWMIESEGL